MYTGVKIVTIDGEKRKKECAVVVIVVDLTDEDEGRKFGSGFCYIPTMTEWTVVDYEQQGTKGEAEHPFNYINQEPGRLIFRIPNPSSSMDKG